MIWGDSFLEELYHVFLSFSFMYAKFSAKNTFPSGIHGAPLQSCEYLAALVSLSLDGLLPEDI